MLDRGGEQLAGDALLLRRLVDDEADERPDRVPASLLARPVLRRREDRRKVFARADRDPADRLAGAVVREQTRLAARADELLHRPLLRLAVLERAVAPVHAPASVRGRVAVTAARAASLE